MQQVKGHTQAMEQATVAPSKVWGCRPIQLVWSAVREDASWLQTPLLFRLPQTDTNLYYEYHSSTAPLAASAYGVGRAVVDRYLYCARCRRQRQLVFALCRAEHNPS